jgi:peptide deformylase
MPYVREILTDGHPMLRKVAKRVDPKEIKEIELKEGCLSVPGMVGEIVRHERVTVTGLGRLGQKIRITGEGLLAQCIQHEIDHLDGKLYVDRATNVRPALSDEDKETAEA